MPPVTWPQAESANMKAKLLAPTRPEQEDSNIASAMAQVQGKLPAPTNLSDRLTALKQAKPLQLNDPDRA